MQPIWLDLHDWIHHQSVKDDCHEKAHKTSVKHNCTAQAQSIRSPEHPWRISSRAQKIKDMTDQEPDKKGGVKSTMIKMQSRPMFRQSDMPRVWEMELPWITSMTQKWNLFGVTHATWTVTTTFQKNTKRRLEISDQMPIVDVILFVIGKNLDLICSY